MRGLFLVPALVFAGDAAFASSITPLSGSERGNGSVVMKSCADCPPAPAMEESSDYRVPQLDPGTQKTTVIEINGEKKIARTEAWLGGSPVVHVGKMPEWMAPENHPAASVELDEGLSVEAAIAAAEVPHDGLDLAATTSAVANEPSTGLSSQEPVEFADFQLRSGAN